MLRASGSPEPGPVTELLQHPQIALLERYAVEPELGPGGTATAFMARGRELRRPAALRFMVSATAAALIPACLVAQQSAFITGRVTNTAGAPLSGAQVSVPSLGIAASTRGDGSYTVLVPAARIPSAPVTVVARLIGYKADSTEVTFTVPSATADFALADNPLQLGEVVVTGAGTTSEVEKLGTVRDHIDSTSIMHANEQNLVNALAAKAPNVTVTSSSGDPGASSYVQIRGLTSIESSTGQPLVVIDGVPVDNSTTFNNPAVLPANGNNIFSPNRLIDVNPADIETIEILKGASSGAIYGSRAGQGVILITTKKGRPGQTTYSLRSSWSLNQHTQLPTLQTEYGLGAGGVPDPCVPSTDPALLNCRTQLSRASYGPKLAAGTPVYDHTDEVFQHGYTTDNTLTLSGGSDRTQFFLSGGYSYNRGIVVGDNNHYRRVSVRFNGSQQVTDRLKVGSNIAYSNGSGGFVSTRNSQGGLLLGAWRTPPEFNNLPYLDPVYGLQRSYRFPNPGPGSEQVFRGYDNPFFTANENPATSDVSRTFGGIEGEWAPTAWLKVHETLGLDYSNDERLESWAWSNSGLNIGGVGAVTAGYIRNQQVDHNLTATLSYSASRAWKGTITLGQNLNSQTFQSRQTMGVGLIAKQPFNLSNTMETVLPAYDFLQKLRLESYFAQLTADVSERLHLAAALRNDGVSSFGPDSRRTWFPKGSAAWVFYGGPGKNRGLITYGKLRTAYGQSGTQPTPYLLSSGFTPSGGGPPGVGVVAVTGPKLPTTTLGAERVKELEAGVDLGLFGDKADLSLTHYRQTSSGVILEVLVPTSTGYSVEPANAAELQNRGWEVSLNLRPVTTRGFAWDVALQWARNRGITTSLPVGFPVLPFPNGGGTNGLRGIQGVAIVGQPIGVYYGGDYVRCGRGSIVNDIDIDQTAGQCQGVPEGALYLGPDGEPVSDLDHQNVLGDPNPTWTGSVRTTFRFGKLAVGGLLDVRHGGVGYNGTKGSLNEFGTGLNTAQGRDGPPVVFGTDYLPQLVPGPVAGPGVGVPVPLDERWWRGKASGFSPVATPFIEDAGFVKLREVSLGYTIDRAWVARSLGFGSIELRVAGRNLVSWNNYDGVDPETAILGAASPVRGINHFNNPQTRSWVFTLTLNR
jgi:TonB-linked SusC/RagA family outer membrane protein